MGKQVIGMKCATNKLTAKTRMHGHSIHFYSFCTNNFQRKLKKGTKTNKVEKSSSVRWKSSVLSNATSIVLLRTVVTALQ